jgi:deoxyribodipyrimidine photo-lyase
MKVNIFWFRRDLRLKDNHALSAAMQSGKPVVPLYIFDNNTLDDLSSDDPRINFIYDTLHSINKELNKYGSSLLVIRGEPIKIWKQLTSQYDIDTVFINKDYEPYSIQTDLSVESILNEKGISLIRKKDHVIFEEKEILKTDNTPYTMFTPYKNKWLEEYKKRGESRLSNKSIPNFIKSNYKFPSRADLQITKSLVSVLPYNLSVIKEYHKTRDFPAIEKTSYLGPHLRYGTVSIRQIVDTALDENHMFLNELIWREFFIQILFSFPYVVDNNFKAKYNGIEWRNNENEFERWCKGETGYPFVDAGMRQLNKTGYIHNRVRMLTAGFLCKHLLIDWRWGEAYFAQKLLDYELASNNGNWQWAAGTGSDAVPYFRIFNPVIQQKKFDKDLIYTKRWIPEYGTGSYPEPMIDNNYARKRALTAYSIETLRTSES